MVSVVVPVYNVGNYIDKCLASICKQTYADLEIIIIEGQSSDSSLQSCKKWAQNDARIILISEKDNGLGDARNKGVEIAQGEYIMFVDSDDYLPHDAVKILLDEAHRTDADMICGDYYAINSATGVRTLKTLGIDRKVYADDNAKEFLVTGFPTAWGKLYKTALWRENHIITPSMRHEDCAVFPLLVTASKKIVHIGQPVYWYLEFRPSSLKSNSVNRMQMTDALQYAFDHLKRKENFDEWKPWLFMYLIKFIKGSLREAQETMDGEQYKNTIEKPHLEFLNLICPGWDNKYKIAAIGGFPLRWVIHRVAEDKNCVQLHICFSSLIAQYASGNTVPKIHCVNPFRAQCLMNDMSGRLREFINDARESKELFFVDFTEERYDVLRLADGNIITCSDIFPHSEVANLDIIERIGFGTDTYREMWRRVCKMFVDDLLKAYDRERIYLVQNRLAKEYTIDGTRRLYSHADEIDKMNTEIEKMERFFVQQLGSCNIVSVSAEDFFTDEYCRYGQSPQYLNNNLYAKTAEKIRFDLLKRIQI